MRVKSDPVLCGSVFGSFLIKVDVLMCSCV